VDCHPTVNLRKSSAKSKHTKYGISNLIFSLYIVSVAAQTLLLGSSIRDVRKRLGLTQQEFADRNGCFKNQVSNVESGK
jgi:DNA-binding transcriptional regulator YiaG